MVPVFKPDLTPEERRCVVEGLRTALRAYPEALAHEIEEAVKLGHRPRLDFLACLFERQLGRALSEVEPQTLAECFRALDGARLGDLMFDLTPEPLGAWLAGPEAPR